MARLLEENVDVFARTLDILEKSPDYLKEFGKDLKDQSSQFDELKKIIALIGN